MVSGDSESAPQGGPVRLPTALEVHRERLERELRARFHGQGQPGISAGVEYQLASGGKRLRPTIALWLAEALGSEEQCQREESQIEPDPKDAGFGTEPTESGSENALSFALAVELLHNVFLIHDDIEDGDTYRRGRKTLWAELGVETALNVSDYLLAESYRLVGETPVGPERRLELFEHFTATFRTTVEGQALDLHWRADSAFTIAEYEKIIRRKTGRYLALGWVGAALIAGVPALELESLWRIGEELGPAFQIRDDVLDLTPGKGRGGEIGCDIREGKPSILVAFTLERARQGATADSSTSISGTERERFVETLARPREQTTPEDVAWVVALYERIGAIEFANAEAERRTRLGIEHFEALPFVPAAAAGTFRQIAEFICLRNV